MEECPGRVGVCVCTYGHFVVAASAVASARKYTDNALLMVIDDGSPDWDKGDHPFVGAAAVDVPAILTPHIGSLTRSWNHGLALCRAYGCEYSVLANSDVIFSPQWWDRLRRGLALCDFAGPSTNAPGHVPAQRAYIEGPLADDEATIARIAERSETYWGLVVQQTNRLNGFCFAGRTDSFFRFGSGPKHVFDPQIPMAGNEDAFFRRVRLAGGRLGIVPASFVFHYRGLSRGIIGQRLSQGAFRTTQSDV